MISSVVGPVLLGIFTWTLLEYVFHRWAGHGRGFWRITPFGIEHTRHHAEGNYFAPTIRKAIAAIVIMMLIAPVSIVLTNQTVGLSFASSLVGTYVAYEFLHRRIHTHASDTRYGRWARLHHLHHHFVNPRTNHGVTSPFWDVVFGTYEKPETIHVPARLCMKWLVNEQTGTVIDTYADRFTVGTRIRD